MHGYIFLFYIPKPIHVLYVHTYLFQRMGDGCVLLRMVEIVDGLELGKQEMPNKSKMKIKFDETLWKTCCFMNSWC